MIVMSKRVLRLILCLCWLGLGACQVAPEDELEAAQKQIQAARKADADQYAPDLLRSAEDLLSDASLKISEKSYKEARNLAIQAREKAEQAEKAASEKQALEKEESARFFSETQRQFNDLKTRIDTLGPEHSLARMKLQQKVTEVDGFILLYKGKVVARRFSDARAIEASLRQKLQELSTNLDLALHPELSKEKKEADKKPR